MATEPDYRQKDIALIHIAKLPPASPPDPSSLWAVPDGPIHGNVILPDNRGTHALEPLIAALAAALTPHLHGVHRIALWRVPPCVALALTPALRRLRVAPAWLNDRWSLRDATRAFKLSSAPVIAIGARGTPDIAPSGTVLMLSPLPTPAVRIIRTAAPTAAPVPACTDEALFFTSGSGGVPKCARLANSAMDTQAREKLARLPLRRARSFIHLAPLYHVGGASSALAATMVGCDHVVPSDAGGLLARAPALVDTFRSNEVETLVVVPAVLSALTDASDVPVNCVRAILIGGARASTALVRKTEVLFPNAKLLAAYGLTECASSLAFSNADASAARTPSHVQLAVRAHRRGVRGAILTRGPHVMRGYIGDNTRASDAWLDTGDVGYVDENGALVLAGRVRDIIRSAGESIYPIEVEDALAAHDAVAQAAVVGLPHRLLGEAVVAAVTLRTFVEAETLTKWCRDRLSPFKVPRAIVPLADLPTNALGKVVRPALRNLLVDRLAGHARLAKL